jgi:hypothetical protein
MLMLNNVVIVVLCKYMYIYAFILFICLDDEYVCDWTSDDDDDELVRVMMIIIMVKW